MDVVVEAESGSFVREIIVERVRKALSRNAKVKESCLLLPHTTCPFVPP